MTYLNGVKRTGEWTTTHKPTTVENRRRPSTTLVNADSETYLDTKVKQTHLCRFSPYRPSIRSTEHGVTNMVTCEGKRPIVIRNF